MIAARALDDTWIDPRVWQSHPDYVVTLMAAQGLVGRPDDARGDDALLRRCADGLPRIDPLTDLYNAVSVQHLVLIGGEDLDGYDGPTRLVLAEGTETTRTRLNSETTRALFIFDGLGEAPLTASRQLPTHSSATCTTVGPRPSSPVGSSSVPSRPDRRPMLIHPWDAPLDAQEWRDWLGAAAMFGQLVVNNVDPAEAPLVVPTHAVLDGDVLLIHLARPNPVWRHVETATKVLFTVVGDYAYIPSTWRAKAGGEDEDGVPTSYYATVQLTGRPTILDDPEAKAALLRTQMSAIQPEGGHAEIAVGLQPYGRMLPGIRGLRLDIIHVTAKFKYDDHNPIDHRRRVSANLDQRGRLHDPGAAAQQRRRLGRLTGGGSA